MRPLSCVRAVAALVVVAALQHVLSRRSPHSGPGAAYNTSAEPSVAGNGRRLARQMLVSSDSTAKTPPPPPEVKMVALISRALFDYDEHVSRFR